MLFVLDELSWLIIWIAAGAAALTTFATLPTRRSITFALLAVAFVGSASLLVSTSNILLFLAFWELTSTICWAIGKTGLRSFNAGLGPLATSWVGSLGSVAMLVVVFLLIVQSGSLSMGDLKTNNPQLLAILLIVATSFKSLGLLSMAWFPGRHSLLSPATALLSGAGVIVIGLYPYLRLLQLTLASSSVWQDSVVWISLGIALLFALAAVKENDLHRVASHLAFGQYYVLVAGFTLGGSEAAQAAALGLIGYVTSVVGLFLTVGLLSETTGSRLIGQTRALATSYPALAVLFVLAAMSVVGLPPLIGFANKTLLTVSILVRGGLYPFLWIAFWLITTISVVRVFQLGFLYVSDEGVAEPVTVPIRPISRFALMPPGIAIALMLSASFWQLDVLTWLRPLALILMGV